MNNDLVLKEYEGGGSEEGTKGKKENSVLN